MQLKVDEAGHDGKRDSHKTSAAQRRETSFVDALLARWLQDNPDVLQSPNRRDYVDLTDCSDWQHVGIPHRANCQVLCTHPAILQRSRIRVKLHQDRTTSRSMCAALYIVDLHLSALQYM
jgi:hypothetical protein